MFGLVKGTASSEDTCRWEQGLCKPTGANPTSCIPPQLKVAKISLWHGPRCLLYDYVILFQRPKEGSLHDEQSSLWTWFHIEWITTEEHASIPAFGGFQKGLMKDQKFTLSVGSTACGLGLCTEKTGESTSMHLSTSGPRMSCDHLPHTPAIMPSPPCWIVPPQTVSHNKPFLL